MLLSPEILTTEDLAITGAKNIYIAYSGGIDSHVLLHLCAMNTAVKDRLTAVYVDHGLQTEATQWAQHCSAIAEKLGVNFLSLFADGKATQGQSPEEAARSARYQVLQTLLDEHDLMFFAQHQDDQLETVLLQLFRGAGLPGLSGMPVCRKFGKGKLLRPLLNVPQSSIKTYARQKGLQHIEDPTNQQSIYRRNFLRNEVIPLLKQHWPALGKTVSRSARHIAQAQVNIDQAIENCFMQVYNQQDQTLTVTGMQLFPPDQQKLLIRRWLQAKDVPMPSEKRMHEILVQMFNANQNRTPEIELQKSSMRRYKNKLYLTPPKKELELSEIFLWPLTKTNFTLPNNGTLTLVNDNSGIAIETWQHAKITVHYRQGGESIRLPGRTGRHTLKKLFQEADIPPWQRTSIPLLYLDDQLAAVAGLWISADYYVSQAQLCYRLMWQV